MNYLILLLIPATIFAQSGASQVGLITTNGDVKINVQDAMNSAFLYDIGYTTLANACNAASGAGKTLMLTKIWSGLPTQSLACNIQAMANGLIKPASGQTVTLAGSFDGVLTQHFDTSAGGTFNMASANVSSWYIQWFGGKGDYVFGTGGTDNCAAFTALGAIGGIEIFPSGVYYSSCQPVYSVATQIQGVGGQYTSPGSSPSPANYKTVFVFASGISGVKLAQGSRGSSFHGIWSQSLSTGSGSDNGLDIEDSWVNVSLNVFYGFGGNGINAASAYESDDLVITQNYLLANYGNGFFCDTHLCGSINYSFNNAVNNDGVGHSPSHGGLGNIGYNYATNNTGGGYYIGGNNDTMTSNGCEGPAGTNMIVAGNFNTTWNPAYAPCSISNTGGPSNKFYDSGGSETLIALEENYGSNNASCQPASASGTTYTCSPAPAMTTYTNATLQFIPDVNCTPGAVTVNVSGLGAIAIKEIDGVTNPQSGDCPAHTPLGLDYDGSVFRISQTIYTRFSGLGGPNSCYGSEIWYRKTGANSNVYIGQDCPGIGYSWFEQFWQSANTFFPIFKNSSSGAGTPGAGIRLAGLTSTNAQVDYGNAYITISSNTNGSQTGNIHIQESVSGSLVDIVRGDDTGHAILKPPTSCSGLATGTIYNNSGTPAFCP